MSFVAPELGDLLTVDVNHPPQIWEAAYLLSCAVADEDHELAQRAVVVSDLALDAAETEDRRPEWDKRAWEMFDYLYKTAKSLAGHRAKVEK